jgi:hypothetical protein
MVVVPRWWQRDRDLMTVDHDRPFRQAEAWIAGNVPHTARLLVDDALWVDLVERGYRPGQVVWFYKLDTDRDVRGRYPRGWREVDYLVSTATLRSFPDSLPRPAKHSAAPKSWPPSAEAPNGSRSARYRDHRCNHPNRSRPAWTQPRQLTASNS